MKNVYYKWKMFISENENEKCLFTNTQEFYITFLVTWLPKLTDPFNLLI